MPILLPQSQLALETRCENQVENEISRRTVRAGEKLECEDVRARFRGATHRPAVPSPKYNCHGLTFASRRTNIWKASEITKILRDDEYKSVPLQEVMAGDIAVYMNEGDAEHSGIVVAPRPVPTILSKWGSGHEVIHQVNDCPYGGQIIYYRIIT